MTLQQQQNKKERGGFNNTSNLMMTMSCPYSRPATTNPHHHQHPLHHPTEYYDTTGCSRKRFDTVVILAMASAIFLYHSYTIHGLATSSQAAFATTTVDADGGEGPAALKTRFNNRKRRVFASSSSSSSSVLAQHDEQLHHDHYDNFRLGREQSFGFFDDIPNHHWQRAQQIHAKTFPNFHQKNKHLFFSVDMTKKTPQSRNLRTSNFNLQQQQQAVDESLSATSQAINHNYADASFHDEVARKESSLWYGENFNVEFHCPLAQRIPPTTGEGDGPKWVCDPHRIASQKKCLIYSVGSNGNVLFEQGIRQEIGSHCEIHTFDIRERNDRNVVFAQALSKHNATFHHWGIGTPQEAAVAAAEAAQATPARAPRMKTLQQTIVELNHSHQTIDIFKIDCESCEWLQYTTWLDAMRAENVTIRQILVETHHIIQNDDNDARDFFTTLHDAGYVIFSKEPNYEAQASCVEFAFVLLSPDFFVNNTLYHQRGYTGSTRQKRSSPTKSVATTNN